MAFSKKLCKAFAAVAIFGAAMTAAAPPAQAYSPPVHISTAATTAATAAATAAAAANARHNREAQNDVIVDPSPAHIEHLKNRGLADWTTIPYIQEAVRDMNIKPGTKPGDITYAQRDQFNQLLKDKRLVAQMSAGSGADAQAKGLSGSLAKYFDATKAELGYSGTVTLPQARAMSDSMEARHWENDTKPLLVQGSVVIGGLSLCGGLFYAMKRRYDNGKYGY